MNQLNFAVIPRKKLIKGRLNLLAKRTLKILELNDRNRRLLRTLERLASYGELGAKNRRRFQVSDDFGFVTEGLKKQCLLRFNLLIAQMAADLFPALIQIHSNPCLV